MIKQQHLKINMTNTVKWHFQQVCNLEKVCFQSGFENWKSLFLIPGGQEFGSRTAAGSAPHGAEAGNGYS